MSKYTVEYSLFIEVEADDAIDAKEKADQIADLKDADVWVNGNYY